jgi:hypothetical protein
VTADAITAEITAETGDTLAVEALKALLEGDLGKSARQESQTGDDSESATPDWTLLEGLAGPASVPAPAGPGAPSPKIELPQLPAPPAAVPLTAPGQSLSAEGSDTPEALHAMLAMLKAGGGETRPAAPVEAAVAQNSSTTLGSTILDSFFAQSTVPTAASAATASATPGAAGVDMTDRVAKVEALMHGMVDRVLVTDPLSGQNQEVRIKFQEGVLPGTEARVWREDGRVMVEFISTRADSVRWLEGAVAALALRLDERILQAAPSQVTVNSGGDSPADGRSREQYQSDQESPQEEATA